MRKICSNIISIGHVYPDLISNFPVSWNFSNRQPPISVWPILMRLVAAHETEAIQYHLSFWFTMTSFPSCIFNRYLVPDQIKMIALTLFSIFAIVASQSENQESCSQMEKSFRSLCPDMANAEYGPNVTTRDQVEEMISKSVKEGELHVK